MAMPDSQQYLQTPVLFNNEELGRYCRYSSVKSVEL